MRICSYPFSKSPPRARFVASGGVNMAFAPPRRRSSIRPFDMKREPTRVAGFPQIRARSSRIFLGRVKVLTASKGIFLSGFASPEAVLIPDGVKLLSMLPSPLCCAAAPRKVPARHFASRILGMRRARLSSL